MVGFFKVIQKVECSKFINDEEWNFLYKKLITLLPKEHTNYETKSNFTISGNKK